MFDENFGKAINSIYSAAITDDNWDRALSSALQFLDRRNGSIQFMDMQTSTYRSLAFQGFDGRVFDDPLGILTIETDIFVQAVLNNPDQDIVVGSRLIEKNEMHRSVFFNEIKPAYDLPYQDAMSGISGDLIASMGIAVIFDDETDPDMTDDQITRYTALWPHFERAFFMRAAMTDFHSQKAISDELIEGFDYAVIGITNHQKVSFANERALDLVSSDSPFQLINGKITICDRSQSRKLEQLIDAASSNRVVPIPGQLVIVDYEHERRWTVLVSPIGAASNQLQSFDKGRRAEVLVKITDHSLSIETRAKIIQQTCNLTHSETTLLIGLLSGWSMNRLAENTGRSIETLRTHLKAIFRKTDSKSQTELARFVLATPL